MIVILYNMQDSTHERVIECVQPRMVGFLKMPEEDFEDANVGS